MAGIQFGMSSPFHRFKRADQVAQTPNQAPAPEGPPPAYEHSDPPAYANRAGDRLLLSADAREPGHLPFQEWLSNQWKAFVAQSPALRHLPFNEREERFTQFLSEQNHIPETTPDRQLDPHATGQETLNPDDNLLLGLSAREVDFIAAIRGDDTEAIHELMRDEGVNINATFARGLTPLHLAARAGHPDMVRLLLQNGGALGATTEAGETPLHLAVMSQDVDTVAALVEAGSNTMAADQQGRSPIVLAMELGNLSLAASMLELGSGAPSLSYSL